MPRKQSKNSRAARRGELDNEIEVDVSNTPDLDGKTRVLEELAAKQVRVNEDDTSLKPKNSIKTKSRSKSKRDKKKALKGQAFNEILAEKIKASTERHKLTRNYRKDDDENN